MKQWDKLSLPVSQVEKGYKLLIQVRVQAKASNSKKKLDS